MFHLNPYINIRECTYERSYESQSTGTWRQKTEECPQNQRTGVDAVHGSCPQRPSWQFVICNCVRQTEIKTIDGGQKRCPP